MLRRSAVLVLVMIASSGYSVAATAQNPGRILNGFHFVPSNVIRSPFVTSYIKTATGAGAAFDLTSLFIDVDGDTLGTLTGDIGFLILDFEYQQQFFGWLAVRGGFSGSARAGVDAQSVLAQGLTAIVSLRVGASARVWNNDNWLVSASVDFSSSDFTGLDPIGFAREAIDSGGLTKDNKLVKSSSASSGRANGRVAWAPTRWIGFTGNLGATSLDVESGFSDVFVGGSVTAGLDLDGLDVVPVGFLLGYASEGANSGTDLARRSQGLTGAVTYTGRDDFTVGLEITRRTFSTQNGSDFNALLATFNIRYWFSGG